MFIYLQRTTKRYAFEVEGIPEDSEYLEVKYSVSNETLLSLSSSWGLFMLQKENNPSISAVFSDST